MPVGGRADPMLLRRRLRGLLERLGIDARRTKSAGFGVDWVRDVAYFTEAKVVLDVGAHHGETVRRLVERFPEASVFAFEPSSASYAVLESAVRRLPRVEPVNAALGAKAGTARIAANGDSGHTRVDPNGDGEAVTVLTADGFCTDRGIEHVDLLKVDTEGMEVSVLEGAEAALESTDHVVCECDFGRRDIERHANFFEIHELLSKRGFSPIAFYTGGVDGRGWRWGDVLYRRDGAPQPVACSPFASAS
jgi:FkbM family methyltransferase